MDTLEGDQYFIRLAYLASQASNCLRRKVGAVLVVNGVSALQASNGTPSGTLACSEGGCPRCASNIPELQGYDSCACVHAEASVIGSAARVGLRTSGGLIYCTLRPCLGCLKMLMQAGIAEVVFVETYELDPEAETLWNRLAADAGLGVRIAKIT